MKTIKLAYMTKGIYFMAQYTTDGGYDSKANQLLSRQACPMPYSHKDQQVKEAALEGRP